MLLAIDIGNTNITLGAFDLPASLDQPFHPEPRLRWNLSSSGNKTVDEFRLLFRQLFADAAGPGGAPLRFQYAALGTVVPALARPVTQGLLGALPGVELLEVTALTPMPVANAYKNPSEVGIDRLANAVGGAILHGTPLIVIDIGTATTFDVVSAEPRYLGGVILPGPALAADALSQRAARLPRVAPTRPEKTVGDTTVGALQSGLYWGMVGSIDFLAEKIMEELGWREAKIVATGGDADLIAKDSRRVSIADPRVTLFGFAEIWRHARLVAGRTR